jgi:hypothetical protein
MSLVSLVYLVVLSYAITPVLRAQDVEEDDELQEWLQDLDDENENEESSLPTEADAASAKPTDATKPAEQAVTGTPTPVPVVKADAPAETKKAPEETKKEQPAVTTAPAADAKVDTTKAAEQPAATSAPAAATTDVKASESVPAKDADAAKAEPKAETPSSAATDTKAEAAKPQEAAAATTTTETTTTKTVTTEVAPSKPAETAAAPTPEVAKETKPQEPAAPETKAVATEAPKAPEATPQPAEAKPAETKTKAEEPKTTAVTPEIPPLPEPPKPVTLTPEQQKKAALEVEQGEIQGIDTVDLTSASGNWLFKQIWWEKSNNLYDKIHKTVNEIADARMHFYTEHVRIDRDLLDPFYTAVGFDQGQLTEIADTLMTQLEKKRQKKGSLDEQELEYYTTVANAKTTIEGFKAAVQSVGQLSNDLRDALVTLVEQLNRVRTYESEALRLLRAISQELDDKIAREYYYGVITQWENVKNIDAYIVGPYSDHFSQLVKALQTQTKTIKDSLEDLKNKGIKFGVAVQEHLETHEQTEAEATKAKPAPKKGWFDWLWSLFG